MPTSHNRHDIVSAGCQDGNQREQDSSHQWSNSDNDHWMYPGTYTQRMALALSGSNVLKTTWKATGS